MAKQQRCAKEYLAIVQLMAGVLIPFVVLSITCFRKGSIGSRLVDFLDLLWLADNLTNR